MTRIRLLAQDLQPVNTRAQLRLRTTDAVRHGMSMNCVGDSGVSRHNQPSAYLEVSLLSSFFFLVETLFS